jgi:hypothetical protein
MWDGRPSLAVTGDPFGPSAPPSTTALRFATRPRACRAFSYRFPASRSRARMSRSTFSTLSVSSRRAFAALNTSQATPRCYDSRATPVKAPRQGVWHVECSVPERTRAVARNGSDGWMSAGGAPMRLCRGCNRPAETRSGLCYEHQQWALRVLAEQSVARFTCGACGWVGHDVEQLASRHFVSLRCGACRQLELLPASTPGLRSEPGPEDPTDPPTTPRPRRAA